MKKATKTFDYIISNEDNEWLSSGEGETQKELDKEVKRIKKEQFDRWGEHYALVIYKAPLMEKITLE